MNMADNVKWQASRRQVGRLEVISLTPPVGKMPSHLVVLCHGFGAPGDDLVGLASELIQGFVGNGLMPMLVFPAAPIDLADEGMPGGRAWWRLNMARFLTATAKQTVLELRQATPPGLEIAREYLTETIKILLQELDLTETELLLGGFSQGAMLALDTALTSALAPPAALALYSGALICEEVWQASAPRLAHTQIYQSHGTRDTILPLATGEALCEMLRSSGCKVHWDLFNGPHTIPSSAISATVDLLGIARAKGSIEQSLG